MRYNTKQFGYSLVEVLVSIAVLLVVIVGPMTIASRAIQYANELRQQTTAFFLAQEGIEFFVIARNTWGLASLKEYESTQASESAAAKAWRWENAGTFTDRCVEDECGIDISDSNIFNNIKDCSGGNKSNCKLYVSSDGRFLHESSGTTDVGFTRILRADPVIENEVYRVEARVLWDTPAGQKEVVLETFLYKINGYKYEP